MCDHPPLHERSEVTGRVPLEDVVTTEETRRRYEAEGLWDPVTLPQIVAEAARIHPDEVAVVDDAGTTITRADLWNQAASVARGLADRGITPGDVVSIQLPNRIETVIAAVGALAAGAAVNPLLPNYRSRELTGVFQRAQPAAVITPGIYRDFDHRDLIASVRADTGVDPVHVVVGDEPGAGGMAFDELASGDSLEQPVPRDAGAVTELIFTSGTEAAPKGVMHTEQTTGFSMRAAHRDLGVTGDDVVWMPSPLGHSTGFNYGMRFALHHGLPLVLQDRWDPERAVELVSTHGCSYTLAATTFLSDLVQAAQRRDADLSSLRFFGCGGAPVPPRLVEEAARNGVTVLRLYGSTEVLVATWNRPDAPLQARATTDGSALTDVEVVLREDGRPVPEGEPGEIFTRGPNTCVGFHDDPARVADTFDAEGWVRSGDLATMDGDGNITIVARRKDIIIRGGMNIAPREIEDLLADHSGVAEVAVLGVPDERLGEVMCAAVVPAPGPRPTLDDLVAHLRDAGISTYKLPQRIEHMDTLPRTASGKVQKHEILRLLENRP